MTGDTGKARDNSFIFDCSQEHWAEQSLALDYTKWLVHCWA